MLIPTEALIAGGFYTFALTAMVGAIGLVMARRVFHGALFLTLTLFSVAAEFVILGADFLAGAHVLVYVGAIMVLILFGIMLTPQQVEITHMSNGARGAAAWLVAGAIFIVIGAVIITSQWPRSVAQPMDVPTTSIIATQLFGPYVLPFEIASVLLLIAMIGAIVIARED